MNQIQINNIDDLLKFVKRKDVSVKDAFNIFEKCIDVVCIIIVDANTGLDNIKRTQIIDEVENIAVELKKDKNYKPDPILFN
jgi:hypothetical protein